ncbi:MAG: hypothetical protein F6K25_19850 [Okeania sp. SIO2G4]|uniref:hypothetical protein n=1 Tax=unclassified Okeania TaxID=2634635 RepID=UPI0013BDDCA9|nr:MULTISPECIES: hypothetical protein [unclassified Okeania]NEP07322.1 hypothetical protein [Okeania sp. SIO4D6]NEP38486.1 hypothetical protein [Okeania sp. SIO2H7]NEP70400.1 hypothetical protein [Okeania sp. SIO2G5]NEP91634.1 hypothetical protein [Okeania sp. SIO2F5]NEQ92801.1 hypothetical protein [Okeania sp. SIO2G4]
MMIWFQVQPGNIQKEEGRRKKKEERRKKGMGIVFDTPFRVYKPQLIVNTASEGRVLNSK